MAKKELSVQRGGFHKPISVTNWILEHLAAGEDYISHMHALYLVALHEAAIASGRIQFTSMGKISRRKSHPYRKTTYHSFEMAVQKLARAGLIEFSGHEEVSPDPKFIHWPLPPLRRYYRLASGKLVIQTGTPKIQRTIEYISGPKVEEKPETKTTRVKKTGDLPLDRGRKKK